MLESGNALATPPSALGLETGEALVIKMEPPRQMLEALKRLGIGTP